MHLKQKNNDSTQRNILMGNRILYNKSVERNQEIHLRKLRDIKSNLRSKSPFSYEINKKKKEQQQETKHTEIERENRILLEKITNIMQNKQLSMTIKRTSSPKSLNQTLRKKQLVQIAEQNHSLLKRLQEKKSNYDMIHYDHQFMNTKNTPNSIMGLSKTPKHIYYGNTPSSSDIQLNGTQTFQRNNSNNPLKRKTNKLNSIHLENNLYGQQNNSLNSNANTSLNGSINTSFRVNQPKRGLSATSRSNSAKNQKLNNLGNINQNFNQRNEKIRLYKQTKVIGSIHFDVEIYMYDGKMMIIADEIEGDETKIIEIPQEEALNFLREECDNEIDSLVLRLRHANNQLFLIGTKKSREKAKQNSGQKSNQDKTSESNTVNYQRNLQQQNIDSSKKNYESSQGEQNFMNSNNKFKDNSQINENINEDTQENLHDQQQIQSNNKQQGLQQTRKNENPFEQNSPEKYQYQDQNFEDEEEDEEEEEEEDGEEEEQYEQNNKYNQQTGHTSQQEQDINQKSTQFYRNVTRNSQKDVKNNFVLKEEQID